MTLEMFHDMQQNPKVPLIWHFLDICVLINIKTKTLVIKIFDQLHYFTDEPDLCYTWGQHHYKTFDGKYFYFPGRCTYKLVADCVDDMFSVHVTNDPNCPEDMKCRRGVELYLGGHDIKVFRNRDSCDSRQICIIFFTNQHLDDLHGNMITVITKHVYYKR